MSHAGGLLASPWQPGSGDINRFRTGQKSCRQQVTGYFFLRKNAKGRHRSFNRRHGLRHIDLEKANQMSYLERGHLIPPSRWNSQRNQVRSHAKMEAPHFGFQGLNECFLLGCGQGKQAVANPVLQSFTIGDVVP
jgi:hypothetical protein